MFALHNIGRIRPFQTEHAEQLLSQTLVISKLDSCNALLAGLPSCANKPRQMFQNAVARLVFHEPKRTHFTPLFISPHWIPVADRIKFKTLMFAYRTATGQAPSYFLRAGPWHRRNMQMLGAPPIHRGMKMSKDVHFCFTIFFITNSTSILYI